jgi:hypothetical protein
MSPRAIGLALMSRDFSAVRAIRTTEAGCQPGETLASAGRGVFVLSTTAYLSTQGELHLGGQRRSLTGRQWFIGFRSQVGSCSKQDAAPGCQDKKTCFATVMADIALGQPV